MDRPKSLSSIKACELRTTLLNSSHVEPLTKFVTELRRTTGSGYNIPFFDPLDGGTHAEVLFLLEAPGPKAVKSGFVSRSNPDETAKNFFLLTQEAGIDRTRTAIWNIVPWYLGSGKKIRPANPSDIKAGAASLSKLLSLFESLKVIVLVGAKARQAHGMIKEIDPNVTVLHMPHTSPMFINRNKENRNSVREALTEVIRLI